MSVQITVTGSGVPGMQRPDARHYHLPFWYDLKIENTPVSLAEMWMQMYMPWTMLLPRRDEAADMRRDFTNTSQFIARRMGLKPDAAFKVMQQGQDSLRLAFSTLGSMKRFQEGLDRIARPRLPNAQNDSSCTQAPGTLELLANAFIPPSPPLAAFLPATTAQQKTFAVKGVKAANQKHFQPKAQVLAFRA